ncbi:MAG TPA: MTH1187 family thiamine-binding protein [Phycisphaerae bacterium]|nr:MTH1187 family thiamine-binding protein [Phycisphaerae bacterium]
MNLQVNVDFCVVPLGVGVSVSEYIAACQGVLSEAGLKHHLHAWGTNIEGPWDAVFEAIKKCHEVVHAMGAPRIVSTVKIGTRTDRAQSLEDKVRSVEEKIK